MKIIGITGKARAGKDTLATVIKQACLIEQMSVVHRRFADPIKNAYHAIFGGTHPEKMTSQEKEAQTAFGFSPRKAMQTLGTEWGRGLNKDLWIKIMEQEIKAAEKCGVRIFVISDLRFDNEAEMVRKYNGIVIEVKRSDTQTVEAHSSEDGLSDPADIVIWNDGSVEDLENLFALEMEAHIDAVKKTFAF